MPPEKNQPPGSSTSKATDPSKSTPTPTGAQQDASISTEAEGSPAGLSFSRYFSTYLCSVIPISNETSPQKLRGESRKLYWCAS